ncbi:MAG: hypothetical protein AABZ14_05420 [Candidatus Margulisiibacteriota bacterium]
MILSICLLAGCATEKKITVKGSDPDNLFIEAQKVFKEEMPRAEINVDLAQRVLKINDPTNLDYPRRIEMRFSRNQADTDVLFIIEEEDKQKLENLHYMLMSAIQKPKPEEMEPVNNASNQNQNNPAMPVKRPGFPVKTKRDRIMDRNKDGWVGPREIEFFKEIIDQEGTPHHRLMHP